MVRSIPIPPNFFAGQKLTGTVMNQVSTVQNFWADPPMFRVYQAISQPITTGVDTQITLDSRDYDTDGAWVSATPYNVVIPAGMTGRWAFTWLVPIGVNATGSRDTYLKRNGARLSPGPATGGAAANNDFTAEVGTTTIAVNAGDIITLWLWQNSGGTLNTTTGANNSSLLEGRLVSLANP